MAAADTEEVAGGEARREGLGAAAGVHDAGQCSMLATPHYTRKSRRIKFYKLAFVNASAPKCIVDTAKNAIRSGCKI